MSVPLDNSIIARSIFSNDIKREVLWNVLEPGDPYDIRNSMIAKMPGDRKMFMGNHLELICLLQTAQIERLSEFLDNYRLKLRDIERGQLDRHSYEIQIKELMQQLDEQEAYKSENVKLKEFISKQGSQIQNLKQNTRDQRGFDQKSFERVNQLMAQNIELRQSNDRFKLQALTFKARVEALEQARIKQIQDLKLNYARYSKESYEGNLSAYRLQTEGQLKQLEFQLKRMKDLNDLKTAQLSKTNHENEIMQKRLIELTAKGGNYSLMEKQIVQYENQIRMFTTENDKLIISLRDYANRLSQSQFAKGELQKKLHEYDFLFRQNQIKLRQKDNELLNLKQLLKRNPPQQMNRSQQQLLQYESRINILTRQNLQLNQKLRYQVNIENQLHVEISTLTLDKSRLGLVYQQNVDLKNANAQTNNLQRRMAELENRNILLSRQIERLTVLITNKDNELIQLKGLFFENESLKAKIREMEASFNIKYHTDLTRMATEYEHKIHQSRKYTGNQLQSNLQVYQGQIERLKEQLRNKTIIEEKYRVRIYELESQFNRSTFQNTARLKNLQDNFAAISKQNSMLKSRIGQFQEIQRKLVQFQNRNMQMERQCQRLSLLLKSRQEQIFKFKHQLNEIEVRNQHSQYNVNRQVTFSEIQLNNSRIVNEQLSRKINQFVNETNKKLGQSMQQVDKLNQIIRKISDERNQLAQQNQSNKQKCMKLLQQNDELRRKVGQSDNQNGNIAHDYSNRLKIMETDNESLKKQLGENISIFNNFQFQTSRRTIAQKEAMARIAKENEELRARLRQSELQQMTLAGNGVGQKHNIKDDQLKLLQHNYSNLKLEHQSLEQHVKDYESLMMNKFQEERAAKISNYESIVQKLRSQNQQLRKRINDEQNRLNQQLDKIRNNFKAIAQQNESIRRIIAQKQILTSNIQQQANANIANYESSIANLTRLNEQQSKKLVENDLMIRQKIEQLDRFQNKYKNIQIDYETAKRQLRLLQQTANSNLQVDVTRRFQQYQLTIDQYIRRLNESQQRQASLKQQYIKNISNHNTVLAENSTLKEKLHQFELSIGAFEAEVNRRVVLYEENISHLQQQKQIVYRKLYEAEQVNQAKISQEGDMHLLSQEIVEYRQRQRLLNDQKEDLKKLLSEKSAEIIALDSKCSHLTQEMGKMTSIYEKDVLQLRQQNQALIMKQRQAEQTSTNRQQQTHNDIASEENVQIKQALRVVNEQNQDLKRQIIQLNKSIEILRQQTIPDLQQNFKQDNTINELGQKIQKLIKQIQLLKFSLNIEANKNVLLQKGLKEKEDMITQYEHQIQSLNNLLKDNTRKGQTYPSTSSQQIEMIKIQNDSLKIKIEELSTLSNRYDSQYISFNQAIKTMTQKLHLKEVEYDQLNSLCKNQQYEINQLQRQYHQLQTSSLKPQQIEPINNYTFYQITIDELKNQNRRLVEINQSTYAEIDRLNFAIHQQEQALQQITNRYTSLSLSYQHLQKNTAPSYQDIPNINQPNQPTIQIGQQGENNNLAAESTIVYLKQTINTLQEQLRVRTDETETIIKQFQEYQQSVHFNFQNQVSKRCAAFQDELNDLHRQNQQLKRQLNIIMKNPANEEQNQIISLMQEINKLNVSLKIKQNQNQNLQTRNRHLLDEQEILRRRLEENSNSNYKNLQYQRQIEEYVLKIEELQLSLDSKTDQLERTQFRLREYEQKKEILKQDIRRMSGASKDEDEEIKPQWNTSRNINSSLTLERDSLLTRVAEFENRIDQMTMQYDRLNQQYQSAIEELYNLRSIPKPISQSYNNDFTVTQHAYSSINSDNEAARRHITEYQLSIQKLYKEFQRLQGIIDGLRNDKKNLGDKNRVLSEEVTRLIRENKQLQQDIKTIQLKLSDDSALQRRVNEHMALIVILFAEIQSLRKRLKQKDSYQVQPTYRTSVSPQIL